MPAYDEAELIGAAVLGIPGFVDHIVVVDDASSDGTGDVVRRLPRPVILERHHSNLGVGAAIATGVRIARHAGATLIAIMGGDGQMDPVDLPALLSPLVAGEADFTKGNRLVWPGARRRMPWSRWLGNHAFSWLTRRAVGLKTSDSQCGYVAMSGRAVDSIDWKRLWRGYGYPNDLLSWVALRALCVREVPVRPVYGRERSGIRARHVALTIPWVIARAWFRRRAAQSFFRYGWARSLTDEYSNSSRPSSSDTRAIPCVGRMNGSIPARASSQNQRG